MIQDFTNHLGTVITNHLGTTINFEHSNWVYMQLDFEHNINPENILYRERSVIAEFMNDIFVQTYIVRIQQSTLLFLTNHLNESITNHLGDIIELYRPIDSDLGIDISNEMIRHKLITNDIEYIETISADMTRHRLIGVEFERVIDVVTDVIRERNINNSIDYNLELNAVLMKRIGFFDSVIIKFKE